MNDEKLNNCNCEDEGCTCNHEHEHEEGCACNHEHEGECGCGCGDDEALIVDLEDENGNIVSCEVVDQFQYKENDYVLVQNPEDEAVYLFKVTGEEGEEELIIPEDDEFDEVSAYYQDLTDEEE